MTLPPIKDYLASSRLNTFQDYHLWQKHKKQAYRAQLDKQLQTLYQRRQQSHNTKLKEKQQIKLIIQQQKRQQAQQKHKKIKTEQKYMKDNFNLMKQINKYNPEIKYQTHLLLPYEHPFIKLVEQEEQRQKQTKNNFKYQNVLNDIQLRMKKQQMDNLKKIETEQSKMFVDYEQECFRNKSKERKEFQRKYLKINKSNNQDCNKEYLQYLKQQSKSQRKHKIQSASSSSYKKQIFSNISPGSIGSTFAAHDRIKQLQSIERSLGTFNGLRSNQNQSSFQSRDIKDKNSPQEDQKPKISSKIISVRPSLQPPNIIYTIDTEQPINKSSLLKFSQKRHDIATQRSTIKNPVIALKIKQFVGYDIILGKQKKIFSRFPMNQGN